jgi:hypothetical protein
MDSEYIFASTMSRTLLSWLNLLNDLDLEQGAVPRYEDNSSAHRIVTSDYAVRGARHINVRYHMVQELHRLSIIDMRQGPTTKALDQVKVQASFRSLAVISLAQLGTTLGGAITLRLV